MPAFRVEKNKSYTVMSNHHLRNKTLSLKAKGLLSQMLSLPEDWDYTLARLASINRESKDTIRSAVQELEAAGYVVRRQTTDEHGKFSVNEYVIYETPQFEPQPEPPEKPKHMASETAPSASQPLSQPLSTDATLRMSKRCLAFSRKTWMPPKSRCASARCGSTRTISSSSWKKRWKSPSI